jgi:ADP-ribosyl-[dinitrogen reductase] hydrolase
VIEQADRFRGCLLGLAVGDAVGTTLEFRPKGSFAPIKDMAGGGPFGLKAGEWTDDTSMALCLATSLVECDGFDPVDQMDRYCDWADNGYLSSTGRCFDIGNTVASALRAYKATGEGFSGSTDPWSAGNGSIMRLAPVPMFYFPDTAAILRWSAESSRTTHGATECIEACRVFGEILFRALSGLPKEDVLFSPHSVPISSERIAEIAAGGYRRKVEGEIRGTGYVVQSLEAALWSFFQSDSFEEAILCAANLGEDADTTAAVCGQVAGAFYGEPGMPPRWLERLAMREEITELAGRLWGARHPARKPQP